jgi:hypothetical protein
VTTPILTPSSFVAGIVLIAKHQGCMFRLGDTVLEEASVLFALAQV